MGGAGERLEVLDVLRRTEQYLARAGIETPRLDAEVLLAFVIGIDRIGLYTGYDRPLDPAERDRYRELVRQRAERVPVAYLTGEKEFWSLAFRVTPAVLVPRPETEHLVERAVALAGEASAPSLLDVGTGSGCIAVAWATEVPGGRFVATDASAAALEVARENARRHGVDGRGEFREGDLFAPIAEAERFDLVACNPPYVGPGEETDPECAHEPRAAIFTNGDPVDLYARILESAARVLTPGGHVLLELPGAREEEIPARAPPVLEVVEIVRDYADRPRVLVARRP